jgi:predicted nucleotidyltransferase
MKGKGRTTGQPKTQSFGAGKKGRTIDQLKVENFLDDFVKRLTSAYREEIDFVLLFGSAARGQFVLGKSDVDLIIQLKRRELVKEVELFAEKLFWELDKKHGMMQKKVCSTGHSKSLLENALKAVEKQARLYKPFEVFGPGDIDWQRGIIKRLDLVPGAILVASQLTLLYKMKHEGRILFGRDIRKEIRPRFSLWERLKAIWVPQSIGFTAVAFSVLLPKKAVSYATKALFYEVEAVNLFFKGKIPKRKESGFANATAFSEGSLDYVRFYLEMRLEMLPEQKLAFIKKAALIKKQGFKGSRLAALKFCWKAFWMIYSVNSNIVLKTFFGKKL